MGKTRKAGAAALVLSLAWAAAHAQSGSISADQIRARLAGEAPPPPGMTRSLGGGPQANPDAHTRVCDPGLNAKLMQQSGLRGEQLTRSMYVEQAPSVDLDIEFEFGRATLLPRGMQQLDVLAQVLRDPDMARQNFVLAGHTDRKGERDYNDRLSCERALSARRYLAEKHRLDAGRLVPMGFGFDRLKDPKQPFDGVNRRVEVRKFQGIDR